MSRYRISVGASAAPGEPSEFLGAIELDTELGEYLIEHGLGLRCEQSSDLPYAIGFQVVPLKPRTGWSTPGTAQNLTLEQLEEVLTLEEKLDAS